MALDIYIFFGGKKNLIMDLKQPKSQNLFHSAKVTAQRIQNQNNGLTVERKNPVQNKSFPTSSTPKPTTSGYLAVSTTLGRTASNSNSRSSSSNSSRSSPRAPSITTTRFDKFNTALGKDARRIKDYTKFSWLKAKRDYTIFTDKHPHASQIIKYTAFPFTGIYDAAKGVPKAAQEVRTSVNNEVTSLVDGVRDAAATAGKDIAMGILVLGLGVYAFWGPLSSAGKTIGDGAKFIGTQTYDLAKSAAPLTPLLLV